MTRVSLALLAAALFAGCANVSHVEVGAIPDDYRTRHPIVVSEGETAIEIPITASDTRLPSSARSRVEEFAARFEASRAAAIRVMVPSGGFNDAAARLAAEDAVRILRARGVRHERILVTPYPATGTGGPVPIRLAFSSLTASAGPCGRWPEDMGNSHENKNYFNFGCASQANLAAQIADPRDLLGPRGMSGIDAERRTDVIERYRRGANTASQRPTTESNYEW
ncbi:CpaD family pilus assembly protein [Aureimonas populi]|uniref:CpaD family pilus assembly protein n=1 Tax=Aureimonas populi TaxID=1701758 RepID=A0ABW5CKS2_9HYPH|nr:CpaD family pilus assembly lipoprotein [Aureimonas populi]